VAGTGLFVSYVHVASDVRGVTAWCRDKWVRPSHLRRSYHRSSGERRRPWRPVWRLGVSHASMLAGNGRSGWRGSGGTCTGARNADFLITSTPTGSPSTPWAGTRQLSATRSRPYAGPGSSSPPSPSSASPAPSPPTTTSAGNGAAARESSAPAASAGVSLDWPRWPARPPARQNPPRPAPAGQRAAAAPQHHAIASSRRPPDVTQRVDTKTGSRWGARQQPAAAVDPPSSGGGWVGGLWAGSGRSRGAWLMRAGGSRVQRCGKTSSTAATTCSSGRS
jgi:hypothetical protein